MMRIGYFLFLYPFFLEAWTISPTNQTVTVKNPQAFYTVKGDGREDPIPIEIYAARRVIDERGNESFERVQDQFIIYPKQVILQKNKQQIVRVIWKKSSPIKEEEAYRIVFDEQTATIPKNLDDLQKEETPNIYLTIGTRYVTSFYVIPHLRVKPQLDIEHFSFDKKEKDQSVHLQIVNKGSQHKILKRDEMQFLVKYQNSKKKGAVFAIPKEDVAQSMGEVVNLLAKNAYHLDIRWKDTYPQKIDAIELRH